MTTDRILPSAGLGATRRYESGSSEAAPAHAHRPVIVPVPLAEVPSVHEPSMRHRLGARMHAEAARPAAIAAAARLAKPRGDALLSTATRVGVLVGVSAAAYAMSLASVARLEAQSQADAVAAAQPALDALASAKTSNDQLDAAIQDASSRLKALGANYNSTSANMAAYQDQFQKLSALVAKIQGSAAAMNANFKLPTVTVAGAVGGGGGSVVTVTGGSGKP